jgi:uridine nucleosidase
MVPLNVTHTAIVTPEIHTRLLSSEVSSTRSLRHTLSTLVTFFAGAYKSTFGFVDGPPIHDALTVAYVSRPDLFTSQRYHVDVELSGTHTSGETVVDVWDYRRCDDTWGPSGKNCLVAKSLDVIVLHTVFLLIILIDRDQVDGFFNLFHDCVARCDNVSPLNA